MKKTVFSFTPIGLCLSTAMLYTKPAYGKGGTMYKTFAHSSSCEFTKSKNGSIKTCYLN